MSYSEDFKIFVATINGEAENCSETSWKVIAHTMRNRMGFANWKSWSNIIQIVTKTGYDAYTQKNSPYKRAKKALDSGDISSKLMSLIKAVEPIFNGTEPDFTGGVVYYYSPKAQAQLHKSDPSNYPSLVPDFVLSKSNPTQQVQISGTEKDDMRWYKVITSIFDVLFVDNAGNPLVGVTVDVVYKDKEPVPLFKDLITDKKGKIKKVKVCSYMGARFKVNGVLVKDKNNKEISLLGDGKNYTSVIVVNNGKGGIKSKTDIHNQTPPPVSKQPISTDNSQSNEKKIDKNKIFNNISDVIFDLKLIDSENKIIPNFSYFIKYKGNDKKHSVGIDGIEKNIVATSGEKISVEISGKDSRQVLKSFTVSQGMKEQLIKIDLHSFDIIFYHDDKLKKPISNLNLVQTYRGKTKSKVTNSNGKITVKAMPGFELNYKLRDGTHISTLKVDKNKAQREVYIEKGAIESASEKLKTDVSKNTTQKSNTTQSTLVSRPKSGVDQTLRRDQKQSTSDDGHPKTLVNDNGETEFTVYTYDQKTNQLFSGGNYSIEYKDKKKGHSSGMHGLGKKIHKGEIGQKIKITAISAGREYIFFDGEISKGMKAFELKLDRPAIPNVSDVTIGFKGVNEQERQVIVSQKTKNVLAYLAKEANMNRLFITSTIRSPRAQAEAMYLKATQYAGPGEAVKKVKADCIAKGLGKEETIQKMVDKIIEFQKKGQRVSKHCVSEEQYRKNNIIDLGTNSNGFGTGNTLNSVGKKFKAVCQKALKDGIISGFISADVPGEGAMHIEIMQ